MGTGTSPLEKILCTDSIHVVLLCKHDFRTAEGYETLPCPTRCSAGEGCSDSGGSGDSDSMHTFPSFRNRTCGIGHRCTVAHIIYAIDANTKPV